MAIFKKLGEGIVDLTQLHVQTFTGDLSTVVDNDASANGVTNWEKLMKDGLTSGKVNLVAATRISLGGNSNTFYDTNISDDMAKKHIDAVRAAHDFRHGIFAFFEEELKHLIKPKDATKVTS